MGRTVGIRREDKSRWERRVPLVPADVGALVRERGARVLVQPSPIRAYPDGEYRAAGAAVEEDLSAAGIVCAVKEIPTALLEPGKVYVFFAHVIKGQPHNMPMLQRLLDLGCTLIDYERIVDERNRRLIFFGRHAGLAGMIETLWCVGRRAEACGDRSPFAELRHAWEYDDLGAVTSHLREIGARIERGGLPGAEGTLAIGIAGYGNVSRGAQEILACLPCAEVAVADLAEAAARPRAGLLKVVFREEDMVRPVDPASPFVLQEYYDHPERYRGCFEEWLPHLDVLVNTIYWDARYPRLLTKEWARRSFEGGAAPRLRVAGDISCDIDGAVELTSKAVQPDAPCFVHDPLTGELHDGTAGRGIVIMAVDNLPCELPRESSEAFSTALRPMVQDLLDADWNAPFEALRLPAHLKHAVIVHRGELTPEYAHLRRHLGKRESRSSPEELR